MITVGAFEAKTHLSALLEKVNRGEEVLITKRGKAIAKLVPAESEVIRKTGSTIEDLITLRGELAGQEINWKDWRDEGRR